MSRAIRRVRENSANITPSGKKVVLRQAPLQGMPRQER
jgi:hypothetical protein